MSNENKIQLIPLELIDPNPQNAEIFLVDDVSGLVNSIKEHGFMGAIDVYLKPDGRYQISAGHRRYKAMKILKSEDIPCIVKELEDDNTVTMKLIESNINIRTLSPMELSKAILAYEKALNEEGYRGAVNEKLMQVFSISEVKLHKLKSISKLVNSLQKYAYQLDFPYEAFYDATYFSQDRQKQLYDMLIDHFNRFPNAELSKNLVTQYIQQIKNEIKLEKEKAEREKILQTIQTESPKREKTFTEPYVEVRKPVPTPQDFPQFVSYEDPGLVKKEVTVVKQYDQPVVHISEEAVPTDNSIDFEMELYVNRILKLVNNNENISISKQSKQKILRDIQQIIDQLKKVEEK